MKILTSCKEAISTCIENRYFAIAHLYNDDKPMNMHIHDSYELYYSISGGRQFLIDNRFYTISPGDLFFINQYESHHLTQIDSQLHERIVLSIYPEFLKSLCTEKTDLNHCFSCRSYPTGHRLSLTEAQQKRFLYFIHRFSDIHDYGADLLERSLFIELMVYLNDLFIRNSRQAAQASKLQDSPKQHKQVDSILSYINREIYTPLTVERLAAQFFLSPSYLCRIFKDATGTTVNKYITAKRISHAKELLSEGHSVNETYTLCGFNDYSNFLKAFTKAVGVSPKKYAQYTA